MRFFVQYNARDEAQNVSFWGMAQLLVLHHFSTSSLHALLDATPKGANHPVIENIAVNCAQTLAWV